MGVPAAALLASIPLVAAPPSSAVSAASIDGFVFNDFDSDGTYDTAGGIGVATDVPVGGVVVKAYAADGSVVGSDTSAADGSYSIDTSLNEGDPVRVEFTIPTTGPLSAFRPSFVGPSAGSTVQFTNVPATDINLGVLVPGEFCQANPNLAISRLCAGTDPSVDASPSVFVTRYDGGPFVTANGLSSLYTDWSATEAGTKSETGSILGMAWDPIARRVYNSAYVRRFAETYEVNGTPALGAIFVTTPKSTTPAGGLGGNTRFLVNLETLDAGDQFSNPNPAGPGYVPTNAERELKYYWDGTTEGGAENQGTDADVLAGQDGVYEEVGKVGIGDIEVDDAGNLYVVSLYTKHLYRVPMPADGSAPTTMTDLGDITSGVSCTNGQGRPAAVKNWRGKLYLGVVCDGSANFDPLDLNPQDQDLTFTVRTYDLASNTWATFFGPYPLSQIGVRGHQDQRFTNALTRAWMPWTDYWPAPPAWYPNWQQVQNAPFLTEIEFDREGSMILGFRDRQGDRIGSTYSEQPGGQYTDSPAAGGDLYKVCRTGAGYETEDYTFEGQSPDCPQTVGPLYAGTEFFHDDNFNENSNVGAWHGEVSAGMTELVPGFNELILNAFDPSDYAWGPFTWFTSGSRFLDVTTGGEVPNFPNPGSGVILVQSGDRSDFWPMERPNSRGGFDKTNGMSDVEALCDAAPLQIGNRIWIDTDKDGIQDPDEPAVGGVTVSLFDTNGNRVGKAVTNAEGEYYFSSNLGNDTNLSDYYGGGLQPNASFTVRLDNSADFSAGGPLFGTSLTTADASAPNGANSTSVDSNCSLVSGRPRMTVSPHLPGNNDHTYDCGFFPVVSVGDKVWLDADDDGVVDAGELPVQGATLTLFLADGTTPAVDINGSPVAPVTSDAQGKYRFSNLPPGQYTVKATAPASYVLVGPSSKTSDDLSAPGASDDTLDFTFASLVSVGDKVWLDANSDGVVDGGELPVQGATLTLFLADGTTPAVDINGVPVPTTTSNASGEYTFGNLPAGQYTVKVTVPTGYALTGPSTESVLSDDLSAPGASDNTLDFGFAATVSVCGKTWLDVNEDGLNDVADGVAPGATLTLFLADGVTPAVDVDGDPVAPVVSDASGEYCFENLPVGQYTVKITTPAGYKLTSTSTTSLLSINLSTPGASADGLDFGLIPLELPATGSDAGWIVRLALAVTLLGALAIGMQRVRRRAVS